jgi:hypothetical protein
VDEILIYIFDCHEMLQWLQIFLKLWSAINGLRPTIGHCAVSGRFLLGNQDLLVFMLPMPQVILYTSDG